MLKKKETGGKCKDKKKRKEEKNKWRRMNVLTSIFLG
jgi:hypothetical protein